MGSRILVAYASRNGSTAEIAEAIGKELRLAGRETTVSDLNSVTELEGYNMVVIGGPLYMGKIVSEVGKFIGRHTKTLSKKPIAAFAVGTSALSPDQAQKMSAQRALRSAVSPLIPIAETVFAGKLDPSRLPFFQRKITEMVKAPVGDLRDWDAIAKWAREVAGRVEK
jgi:menaquinone-dependent protoporphyrinogen oxidase